jgi:hypothetical protein
VLDGRPFAAVSTSRRYYEGNPGDIKELGEKAGGRWIGETHFVSDGNQLMSNDNVFGQPVENGRRRSASLWNAARCL